MKGELTITRQSDRDSKDYIYLSITDKNSCVHIIKIKASLESFMEALTSLASRPIEIEKILSIDSLRKIGKLCETKDIFIDKPKSYNKEEQKKYVKSIIESLEEYKDWELFNDGCSSQQNTNKHRVVLRRWVNVDS